MAVMSVMEEYREISGTSIRAGNLTSEGRVDMSNQEVVGNSLQEVA
jgi:hypothetical protein